MVFKSKKTLATFFLIFFCQQVFSQQIFVTLNPKTHSLPVQIYESEVVEFDFTIINNEGVQINNFNARASVGPQLALIVDGKEKKEQLFTIVFLDALSSNKRTIKVKGLNFSSNSLPISINYGFGEVLTNNFSTNVLVLKNPLQVNARLEKTVLDQLEEGTLLLDIANSSEAELKNLFVAMTTPIGFENNSTPLQLSSFAKKQAILNNPFKFKVPEEAIGEQAVLLEISFQDQLGEHLLEKNFAVVVGKQNQFLVLLLAVVIILLLAGVYLSEKKKESEKKQELQAEKKT